MDQSDLSARQGSARRGYHVLDAHLVHADHVHVALHQEAAILLHDGLLGEVEAIQLVAFVVDLALGRVDIFGRLLVFLQDTSAKRHHLAAQGVHREDHTSAEAIVHAAIVVANHQAGLL